MVCLRLLVALIVVAWSSLVYEVQSQHNVLFLLDTSSSVDGNKVRKLLNYLSDAVKLFPPQTKLGLITFSGRGAKVRISLADYSAEEWKKEIKDYSPPFDDGSPLDNALVKAREETANIDTMESSAIIIFTDGNPYRKGTESMTYLYETVPSEARKLSESGARLVYVGIPSRNDKSTHTSESYFVGNITGICQNCNEFPSDRCQCKENLICSTRSGDSLCINQTFVERSANFPIVSKPVEENILFLDKDMDFAELESTLLSISTLLPTSAPTTIIDDAYEVTAAVTSTVVGAGVSGFAVVSLISGNANIGTSVTNLGVSSTEVGSFMSLYEFVGYAQYVVAGSMMNMPYAPRNYLDVATSLGYTTLIVIPMGNSNDDSDTTSNRVLSSPVIDDAVQIYLDTWNIESEFLLLSFMTSLLIALCVAIAGYIISKYIQYWILKHKPQKFRKKRIDAAHSTGSQVVSKPQCSEAVIDISGKNVTEAKPSSVIFSSKSCPSINASSEEFSILDLDQTAVKQPEDHCLMVEEPKENKNVKRLAQLSFSEDQRSGSMKQVKQIQSNDTAPLNEKETNTVIRDEQNTDLSKNIPKEKLSPIRSFSDTFAIENLQNKRQAEEDTEKGSKPETKDEYFKLSKHRILNLLTSIVVQITYFLSFPISFVIFYQMNIMAQTGSENEHNKTAVIVSSIVLIPLLVLFLYFVYVCIRETRLLPDTKVNENDSKYELKEKQEKSSAGKSNLKSPYLSLVKDWRYECRLFWVARMSVNIVRGATIGLIVSGTPHPVQPVIFLVIALTYLGLLIYFWPYKTGTHNKLAIFVSVLYIPSTVMLILFALNPSPFNSPNLVLMGKAQNGINFAILFGFFVLLSLNYVETFRKISKKLNYSSCSKTCSKRQKQEQNMSVSG